MTYTGRLALMSRIGSATSLYEVFAFAEHAIYPESADPVRLRVLSADGPVSVTATNFDRRTVIDHWHLVTRVTVGRVPESDASLRGFEGCTIGGVSMEYRPDIVRQRFAGGDFTLPAGPHDPAPWHVSEATQ